MPKLNLYELQKMIKKGSYPTYIYFSIEPENHRIEFEPAGLNYEGENGEIRKINALKFLDKEKAYPILLVSEPDNPYDRYAVKIYCLLNGNKLDLGYVPQKPFLESTNPPYFNDWLYHNRHFFNPPTVKYKKEIDSFVVTFELTYSSRPIQLDFKSQKHTQDNDVFSIGFGCLFVLLAILFGIICFVAMISPKIPFSVRFVAFMFLLSIFRFLGEFFE